MKKVLAILLASLMLLSVVPFAAFAKVDPTDAIVADIENASLYRHISYVKSNNEFKKERDLMTGFATYDDAWRNAFTDNVDVKYAEGILLSLIEQIEAEYHNKTFEKILDILSKVQKGAEIAEKIDSFTKVLDLANSTEWGTAMNVLKNVINFGTMANDFYKKYVEAYARVLSIQSASIYYAELLDFIIAKVSGNHADTIRAAANNIKGQMTETFEQSRNRIIAELVTEAAIDGIETGISAAMKTNTITAVIDTVYHLSGTIGKKVFNTQNLYEYMTSLAELVEIEDCVPPYVATAKAGALLMPKKAEALDADEAETKGKADERAWDFAVHALAVMRETGEFLVKKLAQAKSSSTWNGIGEKTGWWSNTDEMNAVIRDAAVMYAKSHAWRMVIDTEGVVKTYGTYFSIEKGKNAVAINANNQIVGKIISATPTEVVNDSVALYAADDTDIGEFVKVVIALEPGIYVRYPNYVVGDGSSKGGSSSSSSGGFGSIFSNLFKSLGDFFKNLFNIFKF